MKKILSLVLALVMICAMATTAFAADPTTGSFTITTSASDTANASGSEYSWNIDVPAALEAEEVDEADVAANYYVVVTWEIESSLKYTIGADAYSWNIYSAINEENGTKTKLAADDTTTTVAGAGYEVDYSVGKWSGKADISVTVTNWSNRALTADVDFVSAKKGDAGVAADITVAEAGISITVGDGTVEQINIPSASSNIKDDQGNVIVADGEYTTTAGSVDATVSIDAGADGENITGGISENDATIGTVTITLTGFTEDKTASSGDTNLTVETTPAEESGT